MFTAATGRTTHTPLAFSPWLTLEQRAHSWRRATRVEKKKKRKMLKNMMQASVTYWVTLCVYVCVYVCVYAVHFATLPHLAKTPNCNCSASLQATHKLSSGICCVGVGRFFSQLLSSIVWGTEYTWNHSLNVIKPEFQALTFHNLRSL